MYHQQITLQDTDQIKTIANNTKEVVQFIQVSPEKVTMRILEGSPFDLIVKHLRKNNPMFVGESHNGTPFITLNVDQWIEFKQEGKTVENFRKPIQKGFYTIVYPNGQHRTIQIKEVTKGNFAGKTIIGFMNGSNNETDYEFFGFLENGKVKFWNRFRQANDSIRLDRIVKAVNTIIERPTETGKAFALNSGKCYRCGRLLTNPESIELGIGSDCLSRTGF